MDRTAIHALLRRPGTFEIDLAATLQAGASAASQPPTSSQAPASKATTVKGPDPRFGLVSEDGIKTLFGCKTDAPAVSPTLPALEPSKSNEANNNQDKPPQEPALGHATSQQATKKEVLEEAMQEVDHVPPHEETAEQAMLRRQAHSQYMRFYRGLRDMSTLS